MARSNRRLATITVERIKKADGPAAFAIAQSLATSKTEKALRLADGDGLYLIVAPTGSARWVFLFRWQSKLKELGLGGLSKVALQVARDKAGTAREMLGRGINPIEEKHARAAIPTFGEVADEVLAEVSKGFKNPKHGASWQRAIGAPRTPKRRTGGAWVEAAPIPSYADPLRPKAVDAVSTNDVLAVLKPLWSKRHETASRLRGQIAQVLDAAKAAGHRSGENPAAWEGNLKHRLAARRKLTKGHRIALPYPDVPEFVRLLRTRPALSAKLLEFTILTAARAGEAIGATWNEIDLDARLWTVPASRMKRGAEHRVPLSSAAMTLIEAMALGCNREPAAFVFPSERAKRPMSDASMMALIRRMKFEKITTHGFRSAFRDWCGDATHYPRDIAELALAHAIGNEVELAYRRSDALERRREMMEAWATFCGGGAEIIELARSA